MVEMWSPLQIAAGCRLHSPATTAVRLGLVDPEQGGVRAMLAARSTAGSTTPWGLIAPEQIELAELAGSDVCQPTLEMVRAVTSGWSASRHWLHHTNVRTAVHVLLLVSDRLRRQARHSAGLDAKEED